MPRLLTIDSSTPVVFCLLAVPCLGAPPDKPAPLDQPVPQIATVPIPGATFTMGTPLEKGAPGYYADEAPVRVRVKSFRIGKFPVTATQICAFLNSEQAPQTNRGTLYHKDMGEDNYSTIVLTDEGKFVPRKNAEEAPADTMTWKGAVLFCRWLSDQTGKEFRLPSEAEWELAAGGAEKRPWPWGDEDPGPRHGERYSGRGGYSATTGAVGSHPANATPEGVHDLLAYYSGEWCANKYRANPTADQATDTRADPGDLSRRVARGKFTRSYQRGGLYSFIGRYGWQSSRGRPWTRFRYRPIRVAGYGGSFGGYCGFRVVEVVETPSRGGTADGLKTGQPLPLTDDGRDRKACVRTLDIAIVIVCLAFAAFAAALGLKLALRRMSI